jgi:hypothetical protein
VLSLAVPKHRIERHADVVHVDEILSETLTVLVDQSVCRVVEAALGRVDELAEVACDFLKISSIDAHSLAFAAFKSMGIDLQ